MSRRHTDSSQMKDLLQPGIDHSDGQRDAADGNQHDNKKADGPEQGAERGCSDSSLNQASSSSSSSCSCSCSCSAGASGTTDRGRDLKGNEPQRTEDTSLCCPLKDLKTLQQCDTSQRLAFSRTHTVLVDVPAFNNTQTLVPQDGRDVWHSNFVKMPCSPLSFMVKTGAWKSTQVLRWDVIQKQLRALASMREAGVERVQEAIMKYNPKYKTEWSFEGLANFVKCVPPQENYYRPLFPKMAALALKLPDLVRKGIPLLRSGQSAAVTLSQQQVACLLANAFFCTFPHRNTSKPNSEYHGYPSINFSSLFGKWSQRKKEKLRAVMHYFKQVTERCPSGLVTFQRQCLKDVDQPDWRSCTETLSKLHVTSHGNIEADGAGLLQVDFAASLVGGGVLGSGLLQEEILFLMNPELIVSRLFTEKLADNECLVITGSQRFSCYDGFGDKFEWRGPHTDELPRDACSRLQRQIVAIDALHFKHRSEQYSMSKITRELNKAYCGFKGHEHRTPDIATGKWGCGAFNGDPELKAVIQLMAAAKARRGLAFFTFEDEELKRRLEQIYNLLRSDGVTVGKLYVLLDKYCDFLRTTRDHMELFTYIQVNRDSSRSHL